MPLQNIIPSLYTYAANLITWGDFSQTQSEIADCWVHLGDTVLLLNCMTETQSFLNAKKGAITTCLINNQKLLNHISRKITLNNFTSYIQCVQGPVANLSNVFKHNSFDIIQAPFMLGNLAGKAADHVLRACFNILKSDGTLILIEKENHLEGFKKILMNCYDLPVSLAVKLFLRIQLPCVTHLGSILENNGFIIHEWRVFCFDTLHLICAQKSTSREHSRTLGFHSS